MKVVHLLGQEVTFEVVRKNVKNTTMKVKDNGSLLITTNHRVTDAYIENFLREKQEWIINTIGKNEKKQHLRFHFDYMEQGYIELLGKKYIIKEINKQDTVTEVKKRTIEIYLFEDYLMIDMMGVYEHSLKNEILERWIDNYSKVLFKKSLDKIYPRFCNNKIPYPKVIIRKMTTRWGTCKIYGETITLNGLLIHTPLDLLEYVIAHELTHFIWGDHSKNFYATLCSVMPDFKERQDKLKGYIIDKNE